MHVVYSLNTQSINSLTTSAEGAEGKILSFLPLVDSAICTWWR